MLTTTDEKWAKRWGSELKAVERRTQLQKERSDTICVEQPANDFRAWVIEVYSMTLDFKGYATS